MPRATKRRTTPPLKHDAEWTEHIAPGGKRYYHNRVTKVQHHIQASNFWLAHSSIDQRRGSEAAHLCLLALVCCPTSMGRCIIAGPPGETGPYHAVCWKGLLLQMMQHIKA